VSTSPPFGTPTLQPSCLWADGTVSHLFITLQVSFSSMTVYCNLYHCCRSVTFWYESGSCSVDPYLWLTDPDPDPDPAIFFLSDSQVCFAYYFLKLHLHHFLKIKS
jgi:hypothetical protein